MIVKVLGSSGGLAPGRLLTSFRINESTIMDAGSMAQSLSLDDQLLIKNILLTHAHLDHSGTLPFFVDNVFGMRDEPFVVHAIPPTVNAVREHLFNDHIWPDFSCLPDFKRASMRFAELTAGVENKIDGLTITAIEVNHTIPTVGYLIEQGEGDTRHSILFSGDTAPTERLWDVANKQPNLKAVFVEASFPNEMQQIADVSGHLTPRTLAAELRKLQADVPVFIYHIKPRVFDQVVAQIKAIGRKDIHIVEEGQTYRFP